MLNTPQTLTDDELDLAVGGLNERPIQTLHGGLFSLNHMDVIRWSNVQEFQQATGGRPLL
jgi:hypothetical protein